LPPYKFSGAVAQEVLAEKLELLQQEVSRLRERTLWRLGSLQRTVERIAASAGFSREVIEHAQLLVVRVHDLVRDAGKDCVPAPQVEVDEDERTIDLAWFDVREGRSVGISVDEEGMRVLLHWFAASQSGHVDEPTSDQILERVCWISGV